MRGLLLLLAGCGAASAAVEPELYVERESGTARVQARVAELIVAARESGVPSDAIRERWLNDELVLITMRGEGQSGVVVWASGERALEPDELYVTRDDHGCGGRDRAPAELEVSGDPSSVVIVKGGDRALLISTAGGEPIFEGFECESEIAIEASACGQVLTCRRGGEVVAVGGLWRDGRALDDPCARAIGAITVALRGAVQNVIDEGENASGELAQEYENRQQASRPCAPPPAREVARAREAIMRLMAATPEGDELAAPRDFEPAWESASFSCRHPRAHTFAVHIEQDPHASVWWVTDDEVVEIARTRVGPETRDFVSWSAIDLDGDRVEEVGVHVDRYRELGCRRERVSSESTFLSASWPLDRAPRLSPAANLAGIHPEDGPAVYGDDAQPYVLRDGRLVAAETGFDAQRAAAAMVRDAPNVVSRVEARLFAREPLECAPLREDLVARLRFSPDRVDAMLEGLPDCP